MSDGQTALKSSQNRENNYKNWTIFTILAATCAWGAQMETPSSM